MECRQCREHRMDNIAGYGLEGAHLADLVQALFHGALAVQGVRLRALFLLDGCRHQLHALLQLLRRLQGASTLTALSDCSPRWSEGEGDSLMHACMQEGRQASRLGCLTSTISAPSRFASAWASVKSTLTFPMACFSTSHLQSTAPQSSHTFSSLMLAVPPFLKKQANKCRVHFSCRNSGTYSSHPH